MRKWVLAAALALAATALLAAAALGAFTSVGQDAAPKADGIAVEGKWEITVKEADGRVVAVHRFHNDFNGAGPVAAILSHASSTGRYWLTLSATDGAHACGDTAAGPCLIFEGDDPNGSIAGWFDTLAVSSNGSGQLIVTGEVEAMRSGNFDHVRMLLSRCAATTAPSACNPGAYGNFSVRTLPSPISLVAGQQAIVTVTYTFSAA